jgi:hypothetical protein
LRTTGLLNLSTTLESKKTQLDGLSFKIQSTLIAFFLMIVSEIRCGGCDSWQPNGCKMKKKLDHEIFYIF